MQLKNVNLEQASGFYTYFRRIRVESSHRFEFIDLTDQLATLVESSRIVSGILNIQSMHTTTAIVVNENEPLLLEDMKGILERIASCEDSYQHDNFEVRTVNVGPEEDQNGHSHCKALFLPTSCTLNIANGKIDLGTWQRVFFLELDRSKQRTISVIVLGC